MKDIAEYMKLPIIERQKHLRLEEPCCERGGCSTEFRGLLAYCLNTKIPVGRAAVCCHACHNEKCSNPNHLYWGTSKENFRDMVADWGEERSIMLRNCKIGAKNPNYKLKPWNNVNGSRVCWAKAGLIFLENDPNGWLSKKHGQGRSSLQRKYGLLQGPARCMVKMFREGWNPLQDKDWVEAFGS